MGSQALVLACLGLLTSLVPPLHLPLKLYQSKCMCTIVPAKQLVSCPSLSLLCRFNAPQVLTRSVLKLRAAADPFS